MKKSELKEIIKTAFLAELGSDAQYEDEGAYDFMAEDDFEANANRIMAKNKDLADKKSAVKQAEEDYKAGKISNEEFAKIIQNNQYINKEEVVAEAEEEDVKVKVKVDSEDEATDVVDTADTDISADDEEVEGANDSIVIDKKIVSLSSLPQEKRKILDTLETLRGQAEEFGDQKFMTQVGNTITFFTRDFIVSDDKPDSRGIEETQLNESITFPMWNKIK